MILLMAILSYSISYSNSLLIALLIYSYFVLLLEGISIATWSFGGFYVIYGFVFSRDFVLFAMQLRAELK